MEYIIKKQHINNKEYIFDPTRKKYVINNPEEWIRQHFIHYLHTKKGYPLSLISTETLTPLNKIKYRADIICYNKQGEPILIVECKSKKINITPKVFDQAQNYHSALKTKYIIITNGEKTCCFKIKKDKIDILKKIPHFSDAQKNI